MRNVLLSFAWLGLIVLASTAQHAQADPVIFFGEDLGQGELTPLPNWPNSDAARDAFVANLIGVGTETFESYPAGTGTPLAIAFPGAGTATLLGNGSVNEVLGGGTNGAGRYPISGIHYWESSDQFSIEFDQPIAAFGFFATDIGDFQGQLALTLVNGQVVNLVVPNTIGGDGGSVIFYGFYDATHQYTSISFGNTAPGIDFFGFDDMTLGSLEQLTGACCTSTHECLQLTQPECVALGHVFVGGTCDPNPCLPPTAVCCIDHECIITTREDCLFMGGVFQPQMMSCDPNPCEMYTPTEESSWGRIKSIYR